MNSFKAKKYFLSGLGALALAIGAGNVSAVSTGTISTADNNDGVFSIYGQNSVSGLFGAQITVSSDTNISMWYLGKEAGYVNAFELPENTERLSTSGQSNVFSVPSSGPSTSVAAGLLPFCFTTSGGGAPDSVCNGANPDALSGGTGPNFFAYFRDTKTVDLWLDDGGAGPDDNHDDMVVRLQIRQGEFGVVPVPAAVWLFGSGLLGLVGIARRRRA